MMLSKTSRYGVRAVLFIAAHTDENHLLGIKELSERIRISTPMLSKVLQFLTKKEYILSKKGRNGGFYMNSAQKKGKLMQVVCDLEQSEFLISTCLLGQTDCDRCHLCPYFRSVTMIRDGIRSIYGEDTILETSLKLKEKFQNH